MRSSIFISIFLHAIIITLGVYGLPIIKKTSFEQEIPMVVEIVPMALSTNISSVREISKRPKKKAVKANKKSLVVKEEKVRVEPNRSKKEREVVPELPVTKPKPMVFVFRNKKCYLTRLERQCKIW